MRSWRWRSLHEIFSSERFSKLKKVGARKQWLLWASTGTKNKQDSDVKYIEPLIGPETINTMPMETSMRIAIMAIQHRGWINGWTKRARYCRSWLRWGSIWIR